MAAVEIPFLAGKKKVLAGWVLWPIVTTVITIALVKILGVSLPDAVKAALAIGASIPLYMVGEFVRDIKRTK